MELCTKKLIDASMATDSGLVFATRRDGRWDLVDESQISTLRQCGVDPVKGYVEQDGDYHVFVPYD